jgi:signal transduction histidine kinase
MAESRILIVDDIEENLYLLRSLLQGSGYQVESAANGAEALLKARQSLPSLVIADILMPVMDGFTLCREWKRDERLRQAPFIFYTATYTDERDRELALKLGADQFLIKPMEPAALLEAVRAALAGPVSAPAPRASQADDESYIKEYNAALIRKLEDKMAELERANQELKRDIAERERAEAEREKLSAQLAQAQRMETIGHLAGSVAHDYNNMLSVILANTEFALACVGPGKPPYLELTEIHKAAQRSADLTRQLLAFARKQTVSPRMIDLSATVEGIMDLLRRLVGEGIELDWRPGDAPCQVKMDPSQVDQLLTNLVINARDAISGKGRVAVETGTAMVDEALAGAYPGAQAGPHATLSVSDNGSGVDAKIMEKLFEPFFTTKIKGKGTGLGLATVYGIVKQNHGFITVSSSLGQGSCFKIHFPLQQGQVLGDARPSQDAPRALNGETILLVEDEPAIVLTTRRMLADLGYAVLAASGPAEAMRMAASHAGKIDLLFTDVVLPEMNGRELMGALSERFPGLRCLYMSGYPADVIAHQGILEEGLNFLQKPFEAKALAIKVRQVLEG